VRKTVREEGYCRGLDTIFLSSALRVGVTILPIAAGQWTLQPADNLFLAAWHGEALVGTYGVAYSIASATLLLLAAVNFVFFPAAVTLWSQGASRLRALLDRSLRLVTAALGFAAGGAFLLGPWTVVLLAGQRHAAAGEVLPLIVLGYAAFTVMQIFQFVPLVVERRAGRIALYYALIAAVNLALNALLIPAWAMGGAAAATLASYVVGAALMAQIARSALPSLRVVASMSRPLLVMLVASLAALTLQLPPSASAARAVTSGFLFVATYSALLLATHAVTAEDLNQLRAAVRATLTRR
jgi:O-antigen/teichoic acid export membrane protein